MLRAASFGEDGGPGAQASPWTSRASPGPWPKSDCGLRLSTRSVTLRLWRRRWTTPRLSWVETATVGPGAVLVDVGYTLARGLWAHVPWCACHAAEGQGR